ncbi:MAG: DNA-directed RNA polymerase subunit beta' [Patescibacteria group bacterium]
MKVQDLESIRIKLASPEDILEWSHGEVVKPETINYRTHKAEKDGLFCQKIFGPERDYQCYCGKYKGIRYKGMTCDRCGVEITKSSVRRERMGHIKLATPVSHIWYLRGVPSRMGIILNISGPKLERVVYFVSYIITSVDEEARKATLDRVDNEYKAQLKNKKATITKKNELRTALNDLRGAKSQAREELLGLKPLKVLSEIEYLDYSLKYGEVFEAGTGAEVLRQIFESFDFKKEIIKIKEELKGASTQNQIDISRRLRLFESMLGAGVRPEWMFMTVLPVLPPDLRPIVRLDGGRYAASDLNDLYRRVINRNNRLKYLLEISAPDVIVRNEKRMLQEAVDALIDNQMKTGTTTKASTGDRRLLKSLADMLKGKKGRFRQNLLGKRVDYSGRSVIVIGPQLKFDQVGLPKKMALELFKPFVIKKLLEKELVYNVRGASRLIEMATDEVWENLEEVVKNRAVLLNRAPTLHRLGIQGFYPILIEGQAIKLHPLVCKAFNADFDGDQMAVYLPLSKEAQDETKSLMMSSLNLLKPATGTPIAVPSQDIVLGCYWLTDMVDGLQGEGKVFSSFNEALMALEKDIIDLKAKIKVKNKEGELIETSLGRLLFNEALPEGVAFQNDHFGSKKLQKLIGKIIREIDNKAVVETLDKIKTLGFNYAMVSGISWGMDDLAIPPEKAGIILTGEKEVEQIEDHFTKGLLSESERVTKIIEVWQTAKTELEAKVPATLKKAGTVFQIIDSGARGSWSQPVQMSGMKGLVINPSGQIMELPVKSSYKEGFDTLEYFSSTHGARKGTADTALRTSTAGYLTRRLIDVSHDVIITSKDCGIKEGLEIFRKEATILGQDFMLKIAGRYVAEDVVTKNGEVLLKKNGIIDWHKGEEIIESDVESIKVFSPITCKCKRGVCQKCYGWDLSYNKPAFLGGTVGIVAAQAIGEPGTQLTMRTFHTGGVASGGDITMGLPRVQEIFEARKPKGQAAISTVKGTITNIDSERTIEVKVTEDDKKYKKGDLVSYKVPVKVGLLVKKGDEVEKGQQLFEGSVDLKDLFKQAGKEAIQRYIVKEIQRIYVSQGAVIHDKHIEVIIRQMFSRVKISDSGDSVLSPGQIIEKSIFFEINEALKKNKKNPMKARSLLLGISKVALTTDSFLSAASFQETSRVLIQASLEGKTDYLRGLKENVIIGKLIPAGTGFNKKDIEC